MIYKGLTSVTCLQLYYTFCTHIITLINCLVHKKSIITTYLNVQKQANSNCQIVKKRKYNIMFKN